VLLFRDETLVPWQGDGIDVPFVLPDTKWTFDIALRSPDGGLVVAECRRTTSAVKQEDIAAFAYKVETLRRALQLPVAGIFLTKTDHQFGAVRVAQFNGITLAVLPQGSAPPGVSIIFFRYDAEREAKLRDFVIHVPTGHYTLTGYPVTLTHGKSSDESKGR
jgi:hypothetical protein